MTLTSWKTLAAGALTATTLAAGTAGAIRAQGPGPGPAPAQQQADPPPVVVPKADPGSQVAPPAVAVPPADRSLDLVRPDLAYYLANKEAFPGLTETFIAMIRSEAAFRARLNAPTPAERDEATAAHCARLRDLQGTLQAEDQADPLVAKRRVLIRLALEHIENPDADGRPDRTQVDQTALLAERLRAARARQEAQQAFYDGGRIAIDRLIDADRQVMLAEQAVASTPGERRVALRAFIARLRQIQDKELVELELGRTTEADVAESAVALLEARIMLARTPRPAPAGGADPLPRARPVAPLPAAIRDRIQSARTRFETLQVFYDEGRLTIDRLIEGSRLLMEAEQAADAAPAQRLAGIEAHAGRLERIQRRVADLLPLGRSTRSDVADVSHALEDSRIMLAEQGKAGEPEVAPADAGKLALPARADLDRRMNELERKVDQILGILSTSPGRR